MSVHAILVNGAPGAGKTSFEQMCSYILGPYYRARSTVDKVKEIARQLGWNGEKDVAGRKFLSDLKDALTEYNDLPFNDVMQAFTQFGEELENYDIDSQKGVIFIDVREPKEIERLKKATNGVTLFIQRELAEQKETSNHADANVRDYDYDYYIDNNGTYAELERKAIGFLKDIGAV